MHWLVFVLLSNIMQHFFHIWKRPSKSFIWKNQPLITRFWPQRVLFLPKKETASGEKAVSHYMRAVTSLTTFQKLSDWCVNFVLAFKQYQGHLSLQSCLLVVAFVHGSELCKLVPVIHRVSANKWLVSHHFAVPSVVVGSLSWNWYDLFSCGSVVNKQNFYFVSMVTLRGLVEKRSWVWSSLIS